MEDHDRTFKDIEFSNISTGSIEDDLQLKYSRISSQNSKIPVKTRQFSAPIQLLDESIYGTRCKKSAIPRIASSSNLSLDHNSTPQSKYSTSRKRKSLSPIDANFNVRTDDSKNTPSPMSSLSAKISKLSLQNANKSTTVSPIYSPKIRSKVHTPLKDDDSKEGIRHVKQISLHERTTNLIKSRYEAVNGKNSKGSPSKANQPTRTSRISSKPDDSPLIQRLTRSTTGFNLKIEANRKERVASESPLKSKISNIPRSATSRRIASASSLTESPSFIGRPTRTTQLRQEAINNLKSKNKTEQQHHQQQQLNPKNSTIVSKQKMVKSYTINRGLNDFTTPSSLKITVRTSIPTQSTSRSFSAGYTSTPISSPSPFYRKLSTIEDIQKVLFSDPKTKRLIQSINNDHPSKHSLRHTAQDILNDPAFQLDSFEKAEILKISDIYYFSPTTNSSNSNYLQNFGFDDDNKNLITNTKDHLNYRYEIVSNLGKGMFGDVLKCFDHKLEKVVGVKIMKNDVNWSLQTINEIKILKSLQGHQNILKYYDHFNFRSHICISTELLTVNLLELLESAKFKGFHINVIKTWSRQLLSALDYIHSQGIIHADLKPENVMLISPNSFDIKIIDFGSSCNVNGITYSYIQSRFYRAPEVLLGCRYDTKIDIWSFVTLICEMYTGKPLFPVKNENDLFNSIVDLIGQPSSRTILNLRNEIFEKGSVNKHKDNTFVDKNSMIFTKFDRSGRSKALNSSYKFVPFSKKINIDHTEFSKFLQSILVWDYETRPSAADLLSDNFLK